MGQKIIHATLGCALIALGIWFPYYVFHGQYDDSVSAVDDGSQSVSWRELKSYDYKNQILPSFLAEKLNQNKDITITGFAVPLSMAGTYTDHFLLVPSRVYCIHVPPPPPHLMVEVKMNKGVSVQKIGGPISIRGRLELKTVATDYGNASWFLDGKNLKIHSSSWQPYRDPHGASVLKGAVTFNPSP
ncbi:MAG: DUF3299 domain-containing protein [Proteobacteria bacterium]|nr:DUF3299 domain-containing protein [Pseudomonadota bacterium]